MIFSKNTFSKRQIEEVEKAKSKLIRDINIFEAGVQFVKNHYNVTTKIIYGNEYSIQWIEDMKTAINDIDLKNEKIAGKKVKNGEYAVLLPNYFVRMYKPVLKEFAKVESPIEEMLNEYTNQILKILR